MCCTMSSCCWSAWSLCCLTVTFSLGWAAFHFWTIPGHSPLVSLPVTNVIGPRSLPPPPLLFLLELQPAASAVVVAAATATIRNLRYCILMPFFHDEPRAADTAYIGMHDGIHQNFLEEPLIRAIPNRYLADWGRNETDRASARLAT